MQSTRSCVKDTSPFYCRPLEFNEPEGEKVISLTEAVTVAMSPRRIGN